VVYLSQELFLLQSNCNKMRFEKDENRAAQVAPADPMTRRLFDETTQTDCVYRGCGRHIDQRVTP